MSDFDPAEFLAAKSPPAKAEPPVSSDAGFDPVAFLSAPTPKVSTKPAALFIPEQSTGTIIGQGLAQGARDLARPFVDVGKQAVAAHAFATRMLNHPVDMLSYGNAGPVLRQTMRGVNANIPFANRAVEAMGGPAAVSASDAAAAPGAAELGGVLGLPIGGMEGKIAGTAARGLVSGARGLGDGVRTLGERAIERSAARGATPFKDALVHVGDEALEKGHITAPLVRAGAVATDEAAAALARRLLTPRAAAPLAESATRAAMPDTFADPIDYAALQDAATAKPSPRGAMSDAAVPATETAQIRELHDALKGATKEQADMINKVIAGIQAKSAAPRLSLVPAMPVEQLAPTLAERAAATRDAPMRSTAVSSAREALSAPAQAAPVVTRAPPVPESPRLPPAQTQPDAAPAWEPSKSDERFAKKLKMTVDEYRATMARKYGGPPEALVGTPAWSPSDEDVEFAHRVGLSVPDYRALMSKRMAGIAAGRIR